MYLIDKDFNNHGSLNTKILYEETKVIVESRKTKRLENCLRINNDNATRINIPINQNENILVYLNLLG